MKASRSVDAFRTLEKPMSRPVCLPLILLLVLLLVLGACSKPMSNTGTTAATPGATNAASTPAGNACDRKLVTSSDAAEILGEPVRVGRGPGGRCAVLRVHDGGLHHADDLAAPGSRANNGGYLGCGEDALASDQRVGCRRAGRVAVDAQGDQRGEERLALRHRSRRSRPSHGRDTGETRRPLQQDLRGDVRLRHLNAKPRSLGAPAPEAVEKRRPLAPAKGP